MRIFNDSFIVCRTIPVTIKTCLVPIVLVKKIENVFHRFNTSNATMYRDLFTDLKLSVMQFCFVFAVVLFFMILIILFLFWKKVCRKVDHFTDEARTAAAEAKLSANKCSDSYFSCNLNLVNATVKAKSSADRAKLSADKAKFFAENAKANAEGKVVSSG